MIPMVHSELNCIHGTEEQVISSATLGSREAAAKLIGYIYSVLLKK